MDYKKIVQSLLDSYQNEFPLVERPYQLIAKDLGITEAEVMETLSRMNSEDILSRVGAIYKTHSVGFSILAACAIRPERLEEATSFINHFQEVNHNYERENEVNLWFVITAGTAERIEEVCVLIEKELAVLVMRLPMVKPYKIDLSVKENIDWELL